MRTSTAPHETHHPCRQVGLDTDLTTCRWTQTIRPPPRPSGPRGIGDAARSSPRTAFRTSANLGRAQPEYGKRLLGHAALASRVGFPGSKGEHAKTKCRRVSSAVCPLVSGDWTDVHRNPPGGRLKPRRRPRRLLDWAHQEHRQEFVGRPRPLSRLLQHVRLTVPGQQLRSGRGVDLEPVTESNSQPPAHGADDWLDLPRLGYHRG
jgi:hypothetical protein